MIKPGYDPWQNNLQGHHGDGEHGQLVLGHPRLHQLQPRHGISRSEANLAGEQHGNGGRHHFQPQDVKEQLVGLSDAKIWFVSVNFSGSCL